MNDVLALIPARGGSKRVPRKNILPLSGKPLIAYTIETARKAGSLNRIIVSTDDREIAEAAVKYGAEVPFMRPTEISGSESTEFEFYMHALEWLNKNENCEPGLIVTLYPTSPFRKSETIDKAVELMRAHPEADSLRSIKPCSEHPYKMWLMKEDGFIRPFVKTEDSNTQTFSTQMFPKVYIQNASIYITKPSTLRLKKSPIGDTVIPLIMSEEESVDINTPLDFKFAEIYLRQQNKT